MPIEINGTSTPQTKQAGENTPLRIVRDGSASQSQKTERSSSTDSVNLTGAAELLQRLDSHIANLPVVDNVRVNAIRQTLNDGSFQIDSERVAEKMIDHEIALQRRGQ